MMSYSNYNHKYPMTSCWCPRRHVCLKNNQRSVYLDRLLQIIIQRPLLIRDQQLNRQQIEYNLKDSKASLYPELPVYTHEVTLISHNTSVSTLHYLMLLWEVYVYGHPTQLCVQLLPLTNALVTPKAAMTTSPTAGRSVLPLIAFSNMAVPFTNSISSPSLHASALHFTVFWNCPVP